MGFLDRLLGRDEEPQRNDPRQGNAAPRSGDGRSEDEIALERYRYLLRTAPPEKIEEVHAEAFAKLTPEQRRQVFDDLATGGEQPAGDDPAALARSATRAEMARPGSMERTFGQRGQSGAGGPGFGTILGGSLLGTVAGYVIGSAIVSSFLPDPGYGDAAGSDGADAGDAGAGDAGGGDAGAGDAGGWGDGGGGDFGGGGGFGGGDFGGGDFGGGFDV